LQQISEERKKQVIDLYFNQHKTYAEIAQIMKMSPRDIHAIIKEEQARRQKYEHKQQQEEISSKAYELFSKGKKPVEVAITLNLREQEVTKLFIEYCRLRRLHILNSIYKETNGNLATFVKLYRLMKEKGMSIENVVNAVEIARDKLPYMENLYKQVKDEVEKLQHTRQRLVSDIEDLKYKLSILDKNTFSCEQDCKRTEQQVQELIDRKDRIEKLIANIMDNENENYSKLKQIIKENVKAILSDNKILLSISLTALIQTLKSDPQMVKLIYNMPTAANDREQPKESIDNNNIAKYLEANRNSILDLAEKNYENLIETLTNNAISSATTSNPTFSLPQSLSPTFPTLSDQMIPTE
jgi:predicted HTH domain antitoxin